MSKIRYRQAPIYRMEITGIVISLNRMIRFPFPNMIQAIKSAMMSPMLQEGMEI